jgi:O-antigen/teichoic acid export membrane protein
MMQGLRALLPKGKLARGVTVLVTGTAVGQVLILAASPLLTRLYTPVDFGVLAVFSGLLGILGIVASLRYDLAIPLAEDDERAVNLLGVSLIVAVLICALTGVTVWLWGDVITGWFNAEILQPLLWLLPVGLLAVGCTRAFIHWAIRRQDFGRITRTEISRSIGRVVTQLGFGFLMSGPLGLLVGQIIGQSAGITTLVRAFHRRDGRLWRTISLRGMARAASRYAKLAMLATGTALLSNAGRFAPALFVAALYGVEVAGWFALAQRILDAPALVGTAVARVYLSEAPRRARAQDASMYALFKATSWRLLAFGVLSLGLVVVAGPPLFALVFGSAWTEAGRFAQFLALMALARLVVEPVAQTLTVLERQDLQLAWDALRFAVLLLVFLAAQQLAWSPLLAIGVVSVSMTICYILLFALIRHVLLASERAST